MVIKRKLVVEWTLRVAVFSTFLGHGLIAVGEELLPM
jgi:hypothetical protein